MSGVDDRVVELTFDNQDFESKIGNTLQTLDKLSQSLQFHNAQDGFKNISAAADSVNLSSMAGSLDNISSKFSALGAIGFSVISNLTNSALDFAKTAAEKVLDPILSGGRQRAINLDNARFAFQGLGMDVSAAMDSALAAVKGTAFGLDEAAKAAAQFGASGITAGADMTQSLRAIAGIAAMTNRSFGEIADIMTSSAAVGKVTNQDLLQFATRGLNAAAAYAKATGMTEAKVHEMATAGTLDYASFAKAMDDTFGPHAQEADKTFTGAMGNMHAALSRLGAAFYTPQLENQRKLLNAFSPVIDNIKTSMQPVIDMFTWFTTIKTDRIVEFMGSLDFDKLKQPMQNFADALKNIFEAIGAFLTPVKQAFNEIIPVNAAGTLLRFSDSFKNFTASLKIGGETTTKVREVFYGFFSILDIGWTVLKGVISVLADLVHAILPAGGGILDFSANVGENLRMLDAYLVSGGRIKDFFDTLGDYVVKPIQFFKDLGTAIKELFDRFTGSDAAETSIGRVNSRIDGLESGIDKIRGAFGRLSGIIDVLDKIWDYVSNWFATLGQKIAAAFHPGDFDNAVDIVNVGLFGAIALMIKKFMQGGLDNIFASGTIAKIKVMLGQVTTTLKAMQTDLKADALMKIAIALGVLAASLVVLSLIDSASLTKALSAMGVAFGEMVGTMVAMDKLVDSNSAAVKLGIIGAAMIAFATAAGILTLAIRNLSGLSWDELVKGMVGVTGGLALMAGISQLISDEGPSLVAAGVGMSAMAVGLLILSEAVKSFADMGWAEMGKGMVGVAGGLILITVALNNMPPSGAISGLGLIELSAGLLILGKAVEMFGGMDWGVLGKGLLGIAGALIIVVTALNLLPLDAPIVAAGILIIGVALTIMAKAIEMLGNLDMGTLAKGVGAVAAMMLILVVAVNAMSGAVAGAAALVIVSGALVILSEVMEKLGAMKGGDIVKSLLALAGVLTILGVAGLVLEPVIPALLGLGAAITLMGAGFALFGAGVWLVAKGLEALAVSGVTGTKAFLEMLKEVATAIPALIANVLVGLVGQTDEVLKVVPLLVRLIGAVIDQLLDTIIQLAPKLGLALVVVFKAALEFLREVYPDYIQTGLAILVALLQGIRDNIGEITATVVDIVVNFLDALREKVPELVNAMYDLMHTVIVTVAERLASEIPTLTIDIGIAIINGFLDGLNTSVQKLFDFFVDLPGRIIDIIKSALGISSPSSVFFDIATDLLTGLLNGLIETVPVIIDWFVNLPIRILEWIGDAALTLIPKGWDLLVGFIQGLGEKELELIDWFIGLPGRILGWLGDVVPTLLSKGWDLIKGLIQGLGEKEWDIIDWFTGLPGKIIGWIGDVVPTLLSKGWDLIKGLIQGLGEKEWDIIHWFQDLPGKILGWIGDAVGWIKSKGLDILQGLLNGLSEKIFDVLHWFLDLPGKIIDHIPNPLDILKEVGSKILHGLWDGIEGTLGWFGDKLGSIGGFISDHKGPAERDAALLIPAGRLIMQGLHKGLMDAWRAVERWLDDLDPSTNVVDTMTARMNEALSNAAIALGELDGITPTITPVLDLTKVKMGAKDVNDLLNQAMIAPVTSFSQARTISTTAELSRPSTTPSADTGPKEVTFNQYNTSPEALDANGIYRSTKSQIALAKEELNI